MYIDAVQLLKPFLEYLYFALEIFGAIFISYAAIITVAFLIKTEVKNPEEAGHRQQKIKMQFTSRLLTSLEFFIAADIIKTIISPNLQALALVGITIAIRAALTFLLHKEQRYEKKEN